MDILKAARDQARKDYLDSLRDGRRQRSNTFRPKKGKGSYQRKPKHGGNE